MKSLLCAIVKNENKYIDEWLLYHHNIGFDEIILYDNNDTDGEIIDVSKYGFVTVIDYRGKHKSLPNGTNLTGTQVEVYNDCYHNHTIGYDWVAFFDIDEFLVIEGGMKINQFLSQDKFNDVDAIQLNWEIYGDNGLTHYKDEPVIERFTVPSKIQTDLVKTIVRTNNPNFISLNIHYADIKDGRFVYPNGNPTKPTYRQKINLECAKLKHFYTKTLEEWIERKCNTTDPDGKDYMNKPSMRLSEFFAYNEKTPEKIDLILRNFDVKKDKIRPDVIKLKDFCVYILCGLPGSGKSTYAKQHLSDKAIVSSDEIRCELGVGGSSIGNESKRFGTNKEEEIVYGIFYDRIRKLCEKRQDVVVDDMNLFVNERKRILDVVKPYKSHIKIIYIKTPVEICVERRKGQVPSSAIMLINKALNEPQKNECDELIIQTL